MIAGKFSTGLAWNSSEIVWFSFDNFLFGNVDNLASNHHEAVGGFFDASQERADNTSFEGYESTWSSPAKLMTMGASAESSAQTCSWSGSISCGSITDEPPLLPPDGDDDECDENSQ